MVRSKGRYTLETENQAIHLASFQRSSTTEKSKYHITSMLNNNKQDYRAGKVEWTCWAEGVEYIHKQAHEGFLKSDCKETPSRKKLRESMKRKDKLSGKVYEAKTVFCWGIKPPQQQFRKLKKAQKSTVFLNFKAADSTRRTLNSLIKIHSLV